jgi:hypothetical protein
MNEPASLEDIVSALKREHDDAEDYFTGTLWPEVEAAIRYYEAKPFGDEIDGRSQLVLPDVAEVIEYMAQSVLRNFVSADRVVEIEATNDEDEMGADEATAALDFNFRREQDGYRVLSDWLQSGLLEKVAAIKTVCETEEKITRERVQVDQEQALALDAGEHPALEGAECENIIPQADGTFIATIKRVSKAKRYRDIPLPLAEFRFSRNARHEDDADYIAHVSLKTRSELVEMGFDRDQVADLPMADSLDLNRNNWMMDSWRDTSDLPKELQTVLLCEEYARMDVDGDGIAERIQVFRVADDILERNGEPAMETIEENPVVVFTPFPRAHRLVGGSLADKSMDLQRIRSVVARQLMDGMYNANMPRPLVDMAQSDYAATTLEDILRPVPGAPIRYKGQAPIPYQTAFDVGKSISVLEFWTGERETRTGITRMNQGLDADTLNKTATGAAMMQAQGQQHEEAVARVFGEAFGRLMAKKLRLMKREGAKFPIKLDGKAPAEDGQGQTKYRIADATRWPDEFNTIIRVGLGTGRKEQRLQYLFALRDTMALGYEVGAVDGKGLFRLGSEMVRAMGLGQGDDFFVDPANAEPKQEPPDPAAMKVQADAEAMKAKLDLETQRATAQLGLDEQKASATIDAMREKHQLEMEQKREQAAEEMQLARDKAQAEYDLAERQMLMEADLQREGMAHKAAVQTEIAKNRPGGDLDK